MEQMNRKLCRFRANPYKVRVGIRRVGHAWWMVTISSKTDARDILIESVGTGPRKALVQALRLAEKHGLDGIDLGMEWAYDHPQHLWP